MSRAPGAVVGAITAHLELVGRATRAELARVAGVSRGNLGETLTRMRRATARCPQRIYIAAWTQDDECGRDYPRPVYALGSAPDAAKPRARTPTQNTDAWRRRKQLRAPSVFAASAALMRNISGRAS